MSISQLIYSSNYKIQTSIIFTYLQAPKVDIFNFYLFEHPFVAYFSMLGPNNKSLSKQNLDTTNYYHNHMCFCSIGLMKGEKACNVM